MSNRNHHTWIHAQLLCQHHADYINFKHAFIFSHKIFNHHVLIKCTDGFTMSRPLLLYHTHYYYTLHFYIPIQEPFPRTWILDLWIHVWMHICFLYFKRYLWACTLYFFWKPMEFSVSFFLNSSMFILHFPYLHPSHIIFTSHVTHTYPC